MKIDVNCLNGPLYTIIELICLWLALKGRFWILSLKFEDFFKLLPLSLQERTIPINFLSNLQD